MNSQYLPYTNTPFILTAVSSKALSSELMRLIPWFMRRKHTVGICIKLTGNGLTATQIGFFIIHFLCLVIKVHGEGSEFH